ncbi:MAG: response regulator [Elusimicrobia bacterium]|nr:response regulator [Elusimicrobiota bacterium]
MTNNSADLLVVDDEQEIRDLLSYTLVAHGYRVTTAANGQEALEKLKHSKFQLVISDISMPNMSGIEVLEAIKKIDPEIEVILATGYGTIETAVSAMKKGAFDFIQKPFQPHEILIVVEKALEAKDLKSLLTIYESSKAVFRSVKLERLLPVVVQLTQQMLKADDLSVMLMEKGELRVLASHGLDSKEREQARLCLGERVAGKVAAQQEPMIIQGPIENDSRFAGVSHLREIKSSIVYPLIIEGEMLGVLNANRTIQKQLFTSSDLRNATIFSSQIAQAIYNARLYQNLENKIHELKQIQDQLIHQEKLAGIGQLAAGVAHELNNPLTGIMGFCQLLLQGDSLTSQQREDLENIAKESGRCRDIIQNLLRFARHKEVKRVPLSVIPLLEEALKLVQYDLTSSGIEIIREYADSLPSILGDASQLRHVFLNILMNAAQAMQDKRPGKLTVRAHPSSNHVVFVFEDTGCGISKANLGRVFEPFFTTKPIGKGTGLGLSISYGIVQQHQGSIKIDSEEGIGTKVTLELPRTELKAQNEG